MRQLRHPKVEEITLTGVLRRAQRSDPPVDRLRSGGSRRRAGLGRLRCRGRRLDAQSSHEDPADGRGHRPSEGRGGVCFPSPSVPTWNASSRGCQEHPGFRRHALDGPPRKTRPDAGPREFPGPGRSSLGRVLLGSRSEDQSLVPDDPATRRSQAFAEAPRRSALSRRGRGSGRASQR